MFQKIRPTKAWPEECTTAWSILSNNGLDMAEDDAHIIARGWLHTQVKHWKKTCGKETSRSILKDEDGKMRRDSAIKMNPPLLARGPIPCISSERLKYTKQPNVPNRWSTSALTATIPTFTFSSLVAFNWHANSRALPFEKPS